MKTVKTLIILAIATLSMSSCSEIADNIEKNIEESCPTQDSCSTDQCCTDETDVNW